jgi:hypothetical protein
MNNVLLLYIPIDSILQQVMAVRLLGN